MKTETKKSVPEEKNSPKKKITVKKTVSKKKETKPTVVETKDSPIREKAILLGKYVWEKIKDYRYVIYLDIIICALLLFLIPTVIFDVKPFIWMIAFVAFVLLPTMAFYYYGKFRQKQIMFGYFFVYFLIYLNLDRCALMDLYGITSHGNLDYTGAWLDAVFVTCIIVCFQYVGILLINVMKKKSHKKKKVQKTHKKETVTA